MIRTKRPMKRGTHINKKYETEITRSKINLPLDQRPKKVSLLYPPEGTQFKKGEVWCPYCANVVKFIHNEYVGVNHCPDCGISERDYYVKKGNHRKE